METKSVDRMKVYPPRVAAKLSSRKRTSTCHGNGAEERCKAMQQPGQKRKVRGPGPVLESLHR